MSLTTWLITLFALGLVVFACLSRSFPPATRFEGATTMEILTWMTAIVTALLLVYLFAALIRPEWF